MTALIGWDLEHAVLWKKINQVLLLVSVARWIVWVALQEMADKPGMSGQPVLRLLTFMHAGVIEHQEDAADCSGKLFLHLGEQSDELFLPLAHSCLSCDLARACIKGCKQVDGSGAFVLVLHAGR